MACGGISYARSAGLRELADVPLSDDAARTVIF